jgi:hypothetical protein
MKQLRTKHLRVETSRAKRSPSHGFKIENLEIAI